MHQSVTLEFRLARIVRQGVNVCTHVLGLRMLAKIAAFGALGVILRVFLNFSFSTVLAGCFGIYLATGGWKFMRILLLTGPRDIRAGWYLLQTLVGMKRLLSNKKTVDQYFDATVARFPNKTCFLFKDTMWRFVDFQAYVNKVANYFHEKGYRKGDVVAIYSENCPEMVAMWLGMSRLGVTAALINFNLKDASLIHCIKICSAKAVIFGTNLQEAVAEVAPSLPKDISYISLGSDPVKMPSSNIDKGLEHSSPAPPPKANVDPSDTLFYIYTSGTTGLPKAAKISHLRFYLLANGISHFSQITPDDILYTSLPLYHTAGGILGIGQFVFQGVTIALRQKFSASQFFPDCIKYKATVSQYIGEICRYLIAQPPKPTDKQHSIRLVYGNGLKPQIWKKFTERFGVKDILEFYGATEGNCSVVNNCNRMGAIGFCTRIVPFLYPITLVKIDPETGTHVRDSQGVCVKCEPGEPGEMVGKIIQDNPLRKFEGYVNDQASKKKVLHDVFSKGDMAFSTGDILVMDDLGFLYFCDRTGDTFRWRGENVSTSEVEAIISNHIEYSDAVVYGVEVPGCEGRAGMVALVAPDTNSEEVALMGRRWCQTLPAYARPLFVRILSQVDTTGTFKLKKNKLRDEGFNPSIIQDPLYYLDPATKSYQPLNAALYENIDKGSLRL